jgi:hypothetical protein
MLTEPINPRDDVAAGVQMRPGVAEHLKAPRLRYEVVCRGPDGRVKWAETFDNLVTNAGRNDVLTQYFKGSAYTAAWYVGLKGAGTAAAADTMGSHGGWSEVTGYSESVRQTLTLGSVSSQSVNNSASKAHFSINATVTIAGAFVTTDNTKSGTTGTLYSAGDFAASRSAASGDTMDVTVTLTS